MISNPGKWLIVAGSINAAAAVTLGAFAAHSLRDKLGDTALNTFQTGVHYHFMHALGLFAVAFVSTQLPQNNALPWVGYLMQAGIILFCGSLYILALGGSRLFGPVTPIGGISFILSWLLLAYAVLK